MPVKPIHSDELMNLFGKYLQSIQLKYKDYGFVIVVTDKCRIEKNTHRDQIVGQEIVADLEVFPYKENGKLYGKVIAGANPVLLMSRITLFTRSVFRPFLSTARLIFQHHV